MVTFHSFIWRLGKEFSEELESTECFLTHSISLMASLNSVNKMSYLSKWVKAIFLFDKGLPIPSPLAQSPVLFITTIRDPCRWPCTQMTIYHFRKISCPRVTDAETKAWRVWFPFHRWGDGGMENFIPISKAKDQTSRLKKIGASGDLSHFVNEKSWGREFFKITQ